ncbi:MAG: tetratricopeptide repeat protein, partial [Betaproteobacteria bacterium]
LLALPSGPTVAVMPFDNLSGDAQQEYFAAGLTEELINQLTRFRDLRVIARNTTSNYKSRGATLPVLHQELGTRYVVEGGVQRDRDTVRVILKLMDASDGTNLWGKTYNRDLTAASLFEIQDEIVTSVAATIGGFQGVVLRSALRDVADRQFDSLASIDCRLRLVSYYDKISAEAHDIIRNCAEKVVDHDPDSPGAWYTLAWIYLDEHRFNLNPRPHSLERALEAATRAVKANPQDSAAHLILGVVHYISGDLDSFRSSVDKALSLNPNDTLTLALGGQFLVFIGDEERGMAMAGKAVALNPEHPSWYHFTGWKYNFTHGDDEAALAEHHKIGWDNFWAQAHSAAIYAHLGRTDEARKSVEKLNKMYPNFEDHYWEEIGKWSMSDQFLRRHSDGLRKAGLNIPSRDKLTLTGK